MKVFWACILAIGVWRIYIEILQPQRLKAAKRIVLAVIVALVVTAAWLSAEDAVGDAMIRGHKCGPWDLFYCVGA